MKFWTHLNIICLGYITNYDIEFSFLDKLSMSWNDQAAQSQNMTFSQRKSWAGKSSDFNYFSFNFNITLLAQFEIIIR